MSDRTDADMNVPTSVYRIFDRADRLLYVGCATDVNLRIYMHRQTMTMADWGVIRWGYARHDSVEYPTRLEARAAEREAIRTEAPWLNRQHNPTRWRRISGQYVPTDPEGLALVTLESRPLANASP